MRWQRVGVSLLIFLCLVLLGISGVIRGQESRRLMMVFTTNTEGEISPCG
jgi:hypothetical protein